MPNNNDELTRLRESKQHFQIVQEITASLLRQRTVEDIVWDVAANAVGRIGLYDCVIYLVDESGEKLIQKAAWGPKNPARRVIINPLVLDIGAGIAGTAAATGEPELVRDTSKDPRYIVDDEVRLSEIAVPMVHQNRVLGVIDSEHPDADFFTEQHLNTLTTLGGLIALKLDQAEALERLKLHAAQLHRRNEELKSFMFMLSHDLRAPLANIEGLLNLYEMNEHKPEEQANVMQMMRKSVKRMDQTIMHVGTHLVESMGEPQKASKVRLDEVFQKVRESLSTQLKETKARLQWNFSQAETVDMPSPDLQSVLQNLLDNAVKYRKPGTEPMIKLSSERIKNCVVLTVEDSGIGMDLENGFNPFEAKARIHPNVPGAGMGLHLVESLLKGCESSIEVESKPDEGATFKIYFPA